MESPAPPPPPPRYQVLAEIGVGGMGRVLRVKDVRLGREIALKRLLPSLSSDPAAVERFLREARAAAAFSHPNAVHVYDVDRDEEGPFIAMELVRGQSLEGRLKSGGPLPAREAVRTVRQVGDALGAAHAAGILHRDVKPSNVLLDEQGIARLSDFGLALFEGKGELTRSLVGTPDYMAPEQAKVGAKIDARADVFSLAATLYACLTGDAPRVVRESRIPAPLRPALLRALSQRPEKRFASMDAFLRALDAASGSRARRARMLLALKWVGAAGAAASVISVAFALLKPMAQSQPRSSFSLPSVTRVEAARPAMPLPVATGEVAPTPKVEARVEQVQVYQTSIDVGYALGVVVNQGQVPIERPRVHLKFLDANGALVLDASGYVAADRIEPGARFPVKALLKPHPRFARFEASVDASPVSYTRPSAKLEVVEKKLERDRFSGWQLFAKVKNADQAAATFSRVTAVLFDAKERIIGVEDGFLAAQKLAAGEVSTATLRVDTFGQEPARFELFLFGGVER